MSKRSLFSFLIQQLNENKYRPTNNFKGTGLKHYGCREDLKPENTFLGTKKLKNYSYMRGEWLGFEVMLTIRY